jgi:2-pyrone-4,6-dicarboxylate lactonase
VSSGWVAAPPVLPAAYRPPAYACDTHTHVFGPPSDFPPSHPSVYDLPEATADCHRAFLNQLGFQRGVLTQPAPYGTDPSAMLAAIGTSQGSLRGVAVADTTIDREALARWKQGGIDGLRFTQMKSPSGEPYPGSVGFDGLKALAPAMRELGIHAQLWAPLATLADDLPDLLNLGVPLVLDHMAMAGPEPDIDTPSIQKILDLTSNEDLWVKLVVCRLGRPDQALTPAIRRLHDAFLAARPDRMVWGSDWPYVRLSPAPDAGRMLDIFAQWVNDTSLIHRVLVDNPKSLYNFGDNDSHD